MNKRHISQLLAGLLVTGVMQIAASSEVDEQVPVSGEITPRQYTFSWMFADSDSMKPRGGTTSGPKVQLDSRTSAAFAGLQVPDLDARERDRRAILAMAGDYRTSFDFIETVFYRGLSAQSAIPELGHRTGLRGG